MRIATRNPKLLLVGAVATVGLAFVALRTRGTPPPQAVAQSTRSDEPSGIPCRFDRQKRLRFNVDLHANYQMNTHVLFGAEGGATNRGVKSMRAHMLWRALKYDKPSDRWTIAGTLRNVDLRMNDQPLPQQAQTETATAIVFEIDGHCRIHRLGRLPETQQRALSEMQKLLMASEFDLKTAPANIQWSQNQTDTLGRYEARYTHDGSAQHIRRRKTRYLELTDNSKPAQGKPKLASPPQATIRHASALADYASDGAWFSTMLVQEDVEVRVMKRRFARVSLTLRLKRLAAKGDDPFWTRAFELSGVNWSPAHLLVDEMATDGVPPASEALIAKTSSQVLMDFADLLKRGGTKNHSEAMRMLLQYLQHDPQHIADLIAAIKDGRLPKEFHSAALAALGKVPGKTAHAALLDVVNDTNVHNSTRHRALESYFLAEDADGETFRNVSDVRRDALAANDPELANLSMLGLGALGSRARLEPPEREELNAILKQQIASSASSETQVVGLAAIGNSRDASFSNDVMALIDHDDPAIRASAYRALLDIDGLPAADVLLDRLSKEQSDTVVDSLGAALVASHPAMQAEQHDRAIAMLHSSLGPKARRALCQLLGKAAHDYAPAKRALIEHYQRETDRQALLIIARVIPLSDRVNPP